MSLSDLASVGTLISSVAVLVSLIYFGLQMRQNARHTRALIHLGRIERIVDLQYRSAEPSMAAAILAAGGHPVTEQSVRRLQFERYCFASFVSLQDSFQQHEDGLLGEDQFQSFRRGLIGVMSEPAVRDYWRANAPFAGSPFAAYVDSVIAGMPEAG